MQGETYQTSFWIMLEAAKLYYMAKMPQKEIAERLNVSNVTVSRLLQRAKEQGVIKFCYDDQYWQLMELALKIREKFFLQDVMIIDPSFDYGYELNPKEMVALETARYLQRTITERDIMGIAWGITMYYMVQYLNPCRKTANSFVTLHGSIGKALPRLEVQSLVKRISMAMGGVPLCLTAPVIYDTAEEYRKALADSQVQKVISYFDRITISVSGVGSFYPELTSPLKDTHQLTDEQMKKLIASGCYCDFILHFLDENGRECSPEFSDRMLTIPLDTYKKIPNKVIAASGAQKAYSLRAVLRGGFADTLIIDHELADALIALE